MHGESVLECVCTSAYFLVVFIALLRHRKVKGTKCIFQNFFLGCFIKRLG